MKGIFIALLVLACMAFLQLERSNQSNVLEARAGYYEKPIATIDFASLYPSIMMAYNLCYCTLVTPEDVRKLNLPPESVNKTPSGETFVKSNLQKASIGMDNLNA
ncbi:DNA polymerase delta catalytic subunit [Arachis hypogaea]|nr:DNA polymerase delta catalytic subunit [Arachis hypogaea]